MSNLLGSHKTKGRVRMGDGFLVLLGLIDPHLSTTILFRGQGANEETV